MSLQKLLKEKFIRFFSSTRNSKTLLISYFLISFFIFDLTKADSNNSNFEKIDSSKLDFLESKGELEDYIIDSGDELFIRFYPAEEFTELYKVSAEGEI